MAKRWSATSLLTVVLLGYLVGTEIDAQAWQNPSGMSKGSPPPQAQQIPQPPPQQKTQQYPEPPPQYPKYPQRPEVLPPQPPQVPKYPDRPQVLPPQPPQVPKFPDRPQVLPPQPPQVPQYPDRPQVLPPQPPQVPKYPDRPQVLPPQPPQVPKYPDRPQVLPPQPPQVPKYPDRPQVLPPQPPQVPKYPDRPQVLPPQPPQFPKYPDRPQVLPPQPPQVPKYPDRPQVLPPQPPQFPKYPDRPQVLPPQPPQVPKYPDRPQVLPPQPPQFPKYPDRPQVLPPQPPQVPKYPDRPQVLPPQPPQFPKYPDRPQVLPPQPPQVPKYPDRPQVLPPQPPQVPKYPDRPQVLPPQPPQFPKYPDRPQVLPPQPPQVPKYPDRPQVLPPQPPQFPKYPKRPEVRPPPKYPYPRGFSNVQSPQEPQVPEPKQPQGHSVAKVSEPYFHSCEVGVGQRVPCGHTDISAAACEAIGCCFAGQQCYFGKAVTIQCTKDAQFIVVVARDATLPHIDLESISLLGQGQSCTHVDSNSEFAIFQFPVTACGSVVMEEPGVIIYENRMTSSFEVGIGKLGVITRDSHYELLFQCRYIGTSVETVVVEVLPLDNPPLPVAAVGPIAVHLRLANGQCNSKGCNEVDVAYTSFYMDQDYPVTKVLRDPVYVEVLLLGKTDPNLVLTLGRCWTTTSPNPHSLPQWDILIDGCPNRDDRYLSTLVPVGPHSGLDFPSHYKRFIFKMFTFVDPASMEPMREHVYIHCSTTVCTAAPGQNCEPPCYRHKRDVEAVAQEAVEPKVVASVGPMIMNLPTQ